MRFYEGKNVFKPKYLHFYSTPPKYIRHPEYLGRLLNLLCIRTSGEMNGTLKTVHYILGGLIMHTLIFFSFPCRKFTKEQPRSLINQKIQQY